jgi:phosphohistidine phosphatase
MHIFASCMKSLLIIRHAKSSWDKDILNDFDRPLNERGKKDAPSMARRLIKAKIQIDQFVSSSAKRARSTAELFAKEFGISDKEILLLPELYHASPQTFKEVVAGLDDRFECVALFSHNPGITSFVNSLTTTRLDDMPTAGIFGVHSPADRWLEFQTAIPQFWFFDYPKAGKD